MFFSVFPSPFVSALNLSTVLLVVATVKETRATKSHSQSPSVLFAKYFIAIATHFSIKFQPASSLYPCTSIHDSLRGDRGR